MAQKPASRSAGRCKHCGKLFKSRRRTKKFCNDECRVDAHFEVLGVNYKSDEDFVQVRNWWLYKYRTDAGIYETAWERLYEARYTLDELFLDEHSEYEDEDDAEQVEYFLAVEADYRELMKTRSIDFEAVKRGREKLRKILMRQKGQGSV